MKLKYIKTIFIISILTLFFSIVIFFVKNFYFQSEQTINQAIEEKYIEPTVFKSALESPKSPIFKTSGESKIHYVYLPNSFKGKAQIYRDTVDIFLKYRPVYRGIDFLEFYMYRDKREVRGTMKDKKLHLFGVLGLTKTEFLSVSIHEFGHFLDVYILKKQVYEDLSEYFYAISWHTTKTIKSSQQQKDFVSGYAMTNKYEDFAETFTYYVLHNRDFLKKSKKSKYLKLKYDFFERYIFRNGEFQDFDSKRKGILKRYYWDTTKIDYDLYDFLEYLQK